MRSAPAVLGFLCLALTVLSSPTAMAASRTWSGLGGNTSWSASANWDALPVADDALFFAGSTRLTNNNNLTANTSFSGITFASSAGAFVLGGTQITLSGGVTNSSTSSQTINLNMILTGTQTFTATNGKGNFIVGGIISGSGNLNKQGANTTLFLNAANTFTGETNLTGGTLNLGNVNALQNSTLKHEGGYTVTLGVAGNNTYNIGNLKGTSSVTTIDMGGNTLSVGANNATLTTYQGTLSGTNGSFTKVGTGTLTLSGNNTYTGNTTIKAGTLSVATATNVNAFGGNGTIIIGDAANTGAAATLQFNGAGAFPTFTNAISVVGNGTDTISATSWNPVFSGTVALSNNLTILSNNSGGSVLTFNGGVTGTGNITVSVQGANNNSKVVFGTATVNNNGTITFDSGTGSTTTGLNSITGGVGSNVTAIYQNSTSSPLTISGSALNVNSGGTTLGGNGSALFTVSSAITGAGGITKAGNGTLTLSGTNTFTGGATMNNGTLNINSASALGNATNTFTLNGGTIDNTSASGTVATQNYPISIGGDFAFSGSKDLIFGNGTATLNGAAGSRTITTTSGNLTIGGAVVNGTASGLTKSGAGKLILSGSANSTYTGPTTILAGTLSVGTSGGANAFGGNGTIIIGDAANTGAAATLQFNGAAAFPTFTNAINVVGNGTGTLSATNYNPVFSGAVALSNNLTILSNNPSGSVLTFNGGITGTGNITATVQNGSISGSYITFGTTPVNNAGTITFNNGTGAGNATAANTITGGVGSNVTAITQASTNSPLTISTNALNVNSGGTTLTASGAALFTVSSGVSGTGNLTLNTNNNTNGISVTTGSVNNIGTVTNSGTGTAATTISSVIGGNVTSVTQNSTTSQLTLTGNNTYTGTTTISAGTLQIGNGTDAGSIGSTSAISNNGSLVYKVGAGNRTLAAAVSGTGSLTQNSTGGTLTLTGANTYSGGTTISAGTLKVGNATALGGNASTVSVASGAVLDLNGTTMTGTNALTLNGTGISSGGALTNSNATAGTYAGLITLGSASSIIAGSGNITLSNPGTITGAYGLTLGGAQNGSIASIIGTGANTLTKQDAGTWSLTGNNTYTGNTNINAGKLVIAGAQTGNGQLIVNNSGILQFGNGTSTAGSAVNAGTIFVNNTGSVQLNFADGGSLSNAVASNPGATTTLGGANAAGTTNTFAATSYNNGGGFAVNSANAGAVLAFSGSSGAIDLKGTNLTIGGAGDTLFTSAGQGIYSSTTASNVTKAGTGTLIYQGNQGYTGTTGIDAGAIRVDTAQTNSGTYYVGNGGTTGTAASLFLGGGSSGLTGGVTFDRSISANIGSGSNRVIGGTNTSGNNTYTGTLTLNDSNVTLQAATGGGVNFNTITAASVRTVAVGSAGNTGIVRLGGTSDNLNTAATVNYGTLQLNKTSSGSVHAVGNSAGTALTVNGGATAQITGTGGDQIYDSSSATVNSGGVLDLNGQNETVAILNLSGTGISNGGALVNNNGSTTSTLTATGGIALGADSSIGGSANVSTSSVISGGFGLTKAGSGTLTLTANNTYSGPTDVTAGTLLANNMSGSATGSGNVTVASNSTLGGSGTIGGATAIAGILSPGNSGIGTLNITGNVTWQGASSNGTATDWIFQLGALNTADLLNITGNFIKDPTTYGTNFRFNFDGATNTGTFKLVAWTGTSSFSPSDFSYTNLGSGLTGSFSMNGSQLDFSVLPAVPEPSTWVAMAALIIAGGTMAMRSRARQPDGHRHCRIIGRSREPQES